MLDQLQHESGTSGLSVRSTPRHGRVVTPTTKGRRLASLKAVTARELRMPFSLSPERFLLAFPMVVLPLFIGGARPWFWGSVAGIFFLGMALQTWTSREPLLALNVSHKCLLIMGALLLLPFIQAVPLPTSWLGSFDPVRTVWLHRALAALQSDAGTTPLSYIPMTTLFAGGWWLFLAAYALALWNTTREQADMGWYFALLFLVAALEALYGLLQVLIPSLGVLWEAADFAGASGSFKNRNHYAAFLGMLWPVLLAYLLGLRSGHHSEPNRAFSEREQDRQASQKQVFLSLVIGLVLLAILFSQSRGAILSALMALTVFIGLGVRDRRTMAFTALCWLIMLAYGAVIGFDEVLGRFSTLEGSAAGRLKIWQETWLIIKDHLWTGTGLGTYGAVISLYQTHLPEDGVIGHAHCDYLELASELGVPLTIGIAVLVWGFWCKTALRVLKTQSGAARQSGDFEHAGRHRTKRSSGDSLQKERLLLVGALAGTASFLCHGWVEFNWQIPAIQLYFITLLILMQRQSALMPRE